MAPTLFDSDAKPGDLIEIFRGTYNHWAVYIGGDEVVHLIPPTDQSGGLGDLLVFVDSNRAVVRWQKLWQVVGSDRFRVNNLLDDEYRPRERCVIVTEACRMVGQQLPYNIATNNCEHFVSELRYGKPESQQVQTVAVIGGVAAVGVAVGVLGAALFAALCKDDRVEITSDPSKENQRTKSGDTE